MHCASSVSTTILIHRKAEGGVPQRSTATCVNYKEIERRCKPLAMRYKDLFLSESGDEIWARRRRIKRQRKIKDGKLEGEPFLRAGEEGIWASLCTSYLASPCTHVTRLLKKASIQKTEKSFGSTFFIPFIPHSR